VQPLAVVIQAEIVLVVPIRTDPPGALWRRLGEVGQRLAASGLPLAVGVSTAVSSFAEVPDAYRQAAAARLACGASHGVVALPSMSAFEYLTLRDDPTASRLIADSVHAFVDEDARDGGTLIATLREYVGSDLNARRAATNLHIHVNTAHYRLAKIAERTGCELRRVSDLIEILIAARLADARTREARSG
jgi:DNA-binding PucR family transcriptional regulator